jgi:hypothetical protein
MRNDLRKAVVATALVWWFVPAESRAQDITIAWPEYDKQLEPGAVIPYQQDPFSLRYNYYAGPAWYFTLGRYKSKWDYIDYIDRVERAEKFGYRIPAPPCGWAPVYSRPRPCVNP